MKKLLVFLFFGLLLAACRKTPDFSNLSSDLVVSTNLDNQANFSSYKTFYISDTLRYIGGVGSDSIITGVNAEKLVNIVKDSLTGRGYTYVGRDNNPDLGLTMTAIKNVEADVVWYPGWWDGYWPPCYWYYWCYPYYYPWTSVYVYTTGSVILNMYDLKNANTRHELKALWNITAFGALDSGVGSNVNKAINALNQGFKQSPYLSAN